jgi:hypothetical protein
MVILIAGAYSDSVATPPLSVEPNDASAGHGISPEILLAPDTSIVKCRY